MTLILLIHDNSTKKTYVNYNFNPPIEDLLIERLYYSLPESKHVKIPDIKKYIIENLENDDHLSRQSAHELDNLIENTLFKDRLTFLKTIGLVPMTAEELKKVQTAVLAKTKLTEEMVKNHTILP